MGVFEMVVAIVLVTTVGRLMRERIRAKGIASPQTDADNLRMRSEVRDLKERIAVLERLATDTNSSVMLDREIEKLRDRS